jgi:hypothetical protein
MNPAERRRHWREYNKSPRGRERYRRWRRSPHGKAKIREKYQERIAFLDEAKSQAGCRICGARDPRVLSLVPRSDQKVKFPPWPQNITRSLEDWQGVIAACDVICRNCLARERGGGGVMTAQKIPLRPNLSWQVKIANDLPGPGTANLTCRTCGAVLTRKKADLGRKRGRRREFCDSRCRLLYWAAKRLSEEHGGKQGP